MLALLWLHAIPPTHPKKNKQPSASCLKPSECKWMMVIGDITYSVFSVEFHFYKKMPLSELHRRKFCRRLGLSVTYIKTDMRIICQFISITGSDMLNVQCCRWRQIKTRRSAPLDQDWAMIKLLWTPHLLTPPRSQLFPVWERWSRPESAELW